MGDGLLGSELFETFFSMVRPVLTKATFYDRAFESAFVFGEFGVGFGENVGWWTSWTAFWGGFWGWTGGM